jgi:hypothetical protein
MAVSAELTTNYLPAVAAIVILAVFLISTDYNKEVADEENVARTT